MAPESYRDDKCTERIDIFSLAMMMWEMITGQVRPRSAVSCACQLSLDVPWQLPWEGSNFQDVRHAVASAGLRPEIPADTPASLAEVFLSGALMHAPRAVTQLIAGPR